MIITFFSFKGGVGKTTLAIQLARYISEHLSQKVILNREIGIDNDILSNYNNLLEVNEYQTTEIPLVSYNDPDELTIWDLKTGMSKISFKLLKLSDIILIPFIANEIEHSICCKTITSLEKHFKLSLHNIFCIPNRAGVSWIMPKNIINYLTPINNSVYHTNSPNIKLDRNALNMVRPTFQKLFEKK